MLYSLRTSYTFSRSQGCHSVCRALELEVIGKVCDSISTTARLLICNPQNKGVSCHMDRERRNTFATNQIPHSRSKEDLAGDPLSLRILRAARRIPKSRDVWCSHWS